MTPVDRADFLPKGEMRKCALPLPNGGTIPTEEMANLLADLAILGKQDKVLEIGTGSGYQAAILAERCKEVTTIEIAPILGVAEKLPANVVCIHDDGYTCDTRDEYDAIIVTFAAPRIMHAWFKQLKEGGRLVIPLKIQTNAKCRVCVYEKQWGQLQGVKIHAYAEFTEGIGV
jgi:protein-L-isoaspartate(D-aspartate) O-methyltransferase